MPTKTPEFCDFDCPSADFPPPDTAGICRTMSAVWCKRLKALVNKNTPCEWARRSAAGSTAAKATRGKPGQRGGKPKAKRSAPKAKRSAKKATPRR